MASHDQHRHLSHDLLIDILTRLPVESLLRFKYVCKKWYALIRNPSFARAHLRIQKIQNKGRLFLHYFDNETRRGRYRHALFPDETLASDAYCHLDSLEQTPRLGVRGGPLNGLFCLFDDRHGYNVRFIIWNPATREFRTPPFVQMSYCLTPHVDWVFSTIGFGTDNSTGRYKVVLIRTYKRFRGVCVNVYSQTRNTWRRLDYLLHEYLRGCCRDALHLDGVYYWWAGSGVLAFDMASEIFRVILAPCILPPDMEFRICRYYDDRIALLCQLEDLPESGIDWSCEIWVMEAEGSWIKLFSGGITIPRIFTDLTLGFWKNCELLLFNRIHGSEGRYISQLALYNPFTQELRYLGPKATCFCFQALVYHESLVSVN